MGSPHPLVAVARDSAALFSKLVGQLKLDEEPEETGQGVDRRYALQKHHAPVSGRPARR